jgi:predicted TIM-barrel fold metal-dependent hydrolase
MELWDVNCLLGRWPSATLLFHDVGGLLARMDELGIARAAVSHTDCLHYDPVVGNAELMDMLAQAGPSARGRLWPAWVLVPPVTGEQGSPPEMAAALDRDDIRLVRLYPRDHNYSLSSPDAAELLALLAQRRSITLLDLEQSSWEEIDRVAAAYPDLPLVVCNVGYRGLRRFAGVLARRPNVRVDLSFLASHQGLEWLFARTGPGQLLFGTGAPLIDGGGGVTRLLLSGLAEADCAAIAHGNLQRLLAAAGPVPATTGASQLRAGAKSGRPNEQVLRGEPVHGDWDVIDAHAHVGPWFNFFTPEPTADSMLRVMDRCGVRMAVVSATRAISTDVLAGNAEVMQMVRRHPRRFAGYAVFNPHQPESLADVERALDVPGIVGIKIHPDVQAYSVNGPLYAPIWQLAARRGVPILTHTFADSPYSDPLRFDSIAARWPEVVILLGHSGVTGEGHRRAMTVAGAHPNLYLELCGSLTTGHWIQQMVASVGPERVLYGSDFPFIELRYGLGRVVFAGLPPEALALVLAGNARRVLRLPAAV